MPDKPLKGIKVLDFGQHGAGSACGKHLADWGADVIKVEPSRGCGSRNAGRGLGLNVDPSENIHHEMINSLKRNISLDAKSERGQEILDKLLRQSNIFFSNYRLSALERLGLDYDTLHRKYPHLICGYLTAYGPEGPKANDPGFDSAAYWSYTGMMRDCGFEESGPFASPFGGGDMVTGLSMAAGLAACLYKQAVTGQGEAVWTSLFGTGCWQASNMIQASIVGGTHYPKSSKVRSSPLGGLFRMKDNQWINVAIMDIAKQGPKIAEMYGKPEWKDAFSHVEIMGYTDGEYCDCARAFYADHTWEEVDKLLLGIDVVHSLLRGTSTMWDDEQAKINHYVYSFQTRNGKTVPGVATPVQFGDREPLPFRNAPLIGEQTREILSELGYEESQVNELFNEHVVFETRWNGGN